MTIENEVFYGTLYLVMTAKGCCRFRSPNDAVVGYEEGWWIRPGPSPLVDFGLGWLGPYGSYQEVMEHAVYP